MIAPDDYETFAAEYVLGTLSHDERAELEALRVKDKDLNDLISEWETRLAPLNDGMPGQKPSNELFGRIEQSLPERLAYRKTPERLMMERQVQSWRAFAFVASLACVVLLSFWLPLRLSPKSSIETVALLQTTAGAPALVVELDNGKRKLAVRLLSAAVPGDKNYELWLIADGASHAEALTVLKTSDTQYVSLTTRQAEEIAHATLAISLEPVGGSPTGAPTGPVIMTGKFL